MQTSEWKGARKAPTITVRVVCSHCERRTTVKAVAQDAERQTMTSPAYDARLEFLDDTCSHCDAPFTLQEFEEMERMAQRVA